jgi:hypothetical protein
VSDPDSCGSGFELTQPGQDLLGVETQEALLVGTRSMEDEVGEAQVEVRLDPRSTRPGPAHLSHYDAGATQRNGAVEPACVTNWTPPLLPMTIISAVPPSDQICRVSS